MKHCNIHRNRIIQCESRSRSNVMELFLLHYKELVSNGDGVNYSILIGPVGPLWNWVIVTYPVIKQA